MRLLRAEITNKHRRWASQVDLHNSRLRPHHPDRPRITSVGLRRQVRCHPTSRLYSVARRHATVEALAQPFGPNWLLASSRRPQRLPVLLRPEIDLDVPDSGKPSREKCCPTQHGKLSSSKRESSVELCPYRASCSLYFMEGCHRPQDQLTDLPSWLRGPSRGPRTCRRPAPMVRCDRCDSVSGRGGRRPGRSGARPTASRVYSRLRSGTWGGVAQWLRRHDAGLAGLRFHFRL